MAWGGGGTGREGERPRQERAGSRRGRSRAARPRVRRGRREPGAGEAVASLTGPAEAAGPGRASPERLCGVRPKQDAGTARRDRGERGAHALEGAGAGSGTGAELHPEACNSWRVRGGVRATERERRELGCGVSGAGRSWAQPEWDRARLLGARVARDWLGGRGAGTREARTQPPQRAPDRSNPPPSLQPRRFAARREPLCTSCGRAVGSAPWKARVNLEVAAGAASVAERWPLGQVSPVGRGG